MSKLFTLLSIVFAGLAGADYLSVAPAVSTNAYGYCLQDYSSAIRTCSFDTLEQCIVGALEIDMDAREVRLRGTAKPVTGYQFALLAALG